MVRFYFLHRYSILRTFLPLPEGFIELLKRGPRYLRLTIQRPGDLIHIPHLPAHAVLTLDKVHQQLFLDGAPLLHRISTSFFKRWMSILLVCVIVSGAKFSVKIGLSALHEWVFSPSTGRQESKEKLQKHWNYWEEHSLHLLLSLHIEKLVPRKIKCNRVPPVQSSELRYTRKDAIGPGPSS